MEHPWALRPAKAMKLDFQRCPLGDGRPRPSRREQFGNKLLETAKSKYPSERSSALTSGPSCVAVIH